MKCDVNTVRNQKDAVGEMQEVFSRCPRERVGIYNTKFGRKGLCEPCLKYILDEPSAAGLRRGVFILPEIPKGLTEPPDSGN